MALNLGLFSGSGPLAFTAIAMSLPYLVNVLAILSQRFSLRSRRNSNALPIVFFGGFFEASKIDNPN
jgi:hypothetical protein